MKKALIGIFITLALFLPPGMAWAVAPPVVVTHTVTGYSAVEGTATVTFSVHVVNPGDGYLSELTLSLVPMSPFAKGGAELNIRALSPHQSVDLMLQLEAPVQIGKYGSARRPIFFAGKCLDPYGNLIEFPVMSHPGGVK